MAKKKPAAAEVDPRHWHKKVMEAFSKQVDEGEALQGFTFSELRKHFELEAGEPGYNEVASATTELRNEGFLAHKFKAESLREDFYQGDSNNIPNILKRESETKVVQVVFFVHPAALSLGDKLPEHIATGEYPEDLEYDTNSTIFTRESIADWFENLGEIIDLYYEQDKETAIKMITALKPEL